MKRTPDDEAASFAARIEAHWEAYPTEPLSVQFGGHEFVVHPQVFNATEAYSSRTLIDSLDVPPGSVVLEMGCGAGIAGILAVLDRKARSATLLDVNPPAIENARANVALHGLADRIEVAESDLFDALAPDATFDVILFNMPLAEVDEGALPASSSFHRPTVPPMSSFADPGYTIIERFFAGAGARLRPDGSLFVTFASFGNLERLTEICQRHGFAGEIVHRLPDPDHGNEYQVYRLRRVG
jgi:release factor glutamine methyltransferase